MQKISFGLSACLLLAVATKPSAAGEAVIGAAAPPAACTEYFECLEYGTLSPEEARKVRGHPQFVEPTSCAVARYRLCIGASRSSIEPLRDVAAIVDQRRVFEEHTTMSQTEADGDRGIGTPDQPPVELSGVRPNLGERCTPKVRHELHKSCSWLRIGQGAPCLGSNPRAPPRRPGSGRSSQGPRSHRPWPRLP